jgi:glycosyltransferase involved in cell wall biosynthesis
MSTVHRVCFFNSNRKWGGGEKWHFEMASAIAEKGFEVTLACSPFGELSARAKNATIKTVRACVSNLSFLNPFKLLSFAVMLKSRKVDTLIINLSSDLKVAGLAARLAGKVRVIYRRGSAIPVKSSIFNKFIFNYLIDDILVNSEETGRTILENNPRLFKQEKIHVIYNGIDLNEFNKQTGPAPYERQGDEIILATVGRLSKQKGHDLLFEAISKLKKTGINFKLLVAGDGELKDEIVHNASEISLSDHVVFLGFLENIKPLLDSSDIFLLPSRWEGFGYVLVEAMACRKPVVAFHASSNPEIVADGKSGFLVKDFDTGEFAEMIFQLINNPQLRNQLGENGRKRVEERFTLDRAVQELTELISGQRSAVSGRL